MNTTKIMTQARFWAKVKVIPQSNSQKCWEWQGGTMPNGYGVASIGKSETMLAHRYAASLSQDITDKVVQHMCDNPLCVRPDHLIVGTQQDNMRDMFVKERSNNKLDIASVRDIRSKKLSREEYALKYGIAIGTVGDVQRRYTWDWVE
jgi:hypothetical protein